MLMVLKEDEMRACQLPAQNQLADPLSPSGSPLRTCRVPGLIGDTTTTVTEQKATTLSIPLTCCKLSEVTRLHIQQIRCALSSMP